MELIKEAVWFWAQKAQKWHFITIKSENFKSVLAWIFVLKTSPLNLVIVRLPRFICWPSLAGTAVWDNSNDHWNSLQTIFWTIIIFFSRFPCLVFSKTSIRDPSQWALGMAVTIHCGPKLSFKDQSQLPLEALFSRLPASEKDEHDSLYLEVAKWRDGNISCFLRMMLSMMEVVGVMLPKTLAKLTCWNMMLLWLMMM